MVGEKQRKEKQNEVEYLPSVVDPDSVFDYPEAKKIRRAVQNDSLE